MLPESIVTLQVERHSDTSGTRVYHAFSDYRRFITGARIIDDPELR